VSDRVVEAINRRNRFQAVRVLKRKKKTPKAATSPCCGDETLEAVAMQFGTKQQISTFINYVKLAFDR
jgi:hypothetical protein